MKLYKQLIRVVYPGDGAVTFFVFIEACLLISRCGCFSLTTYKHQFETPRLIDFLLAEILLRSPFET